jgi:hypothetical protein
MPRRRKPIRRFLWRAVAFALFGALLGVPISYSFQSGIVKALISRSDYTKQVLTAAPSEIWKKANSQSSGGGIDPFGVVATLSTTVIVCGAATTLIGLRLTRKKR